MSAEFAERQSHHAFTAALLATDPPPRRLVATQLATWNAGTVLVAVGAPTGSPALVEGGGALIAAGLALLALALRPTFALWLVGIVELATGAAFASRG